MPGTMAPSTEDWEEGDVWVKNESGGFQKRNVGHLYSVPTNVPIKDRQDIS